MKRKQKTWKKVTLREPLNLMGRATPHNSSANSLPGARISRSSNKTSRQRPQKWSK